MKNCHFYIERPITFDKGTMANQISENCSYFNIIVNIEFHANNLHSIILIRTIRLNIIIIINKAKSFSIIWNYHLKVLTFVRMLLSFSMINGGFVPVSNNLFSCHDFKWSHYFLNFLLIIHFLKNNNLRFLYQK